MPTRILGIESSCDETAAAINRAEEQFDKGQGLDLAQFAADMRKKVAQGR